MYEAEANHALSLDSAAATLLANRKKKRLEDEELDRRGQALVDEWVSERHGDDPLRKREYTVRTVDARKGAVDLF